MRRSPSPHYNDRAFPTAGRRDRISLIILHYTDMPTAADARALMQDPAHKAAAHYMVDVDGSIEQLVDDQHRAFHAGVSYWAGEDDINSLSLGIEIQNAGHRGGSPAYPTVQMDAVRDLCLRLLETHRLNPEAVLGHSDVAPARKIDPGEWFPWQWLAEQGIGFWPHVDASATEPMTDDQVRAHLVQCGYDPRLDLPVILTAFQRHFVPEIFATPDAVGQADALTCARLLTCARHAASRGGALAFP